MRTGDACSCSICGSRLGYLSVFVVAGVAGGGLFESFQDKQFGLGPAVHECRWFTITAWLTVPCS